MTDLTMFVSYFGLITDENEYEKYLVTYWGVPGYAPVLFWKLKIAKN